MQAATSTMQAATFPCVSMLTTNTDLAEHPWTGAQPD
jgi:hypothetical protein